MVVYFGATGSFEGHVWVIPWWHDYSLGTRGKAFLNHMQDQNRGKSCLYYEYRNKRFLVKVLPGLNDLLTFHCVALKYCFFKSDTFSFEWKGKGQKSAADNFSYHVIQTQFIEEVGLYIKLERDMSPTMQDPDLHIFAAQTYAASEC